MNIFIIALGTRGDVQPYIALALGLKKAGHQVTICSSANFRSFITEYGLRYEETRDELFEIMNTDAGKSTFDGDLSLWKKIKVYSELSKISGPMQMKMLEDTWCAAEKVKPDVILYHPKAYGAPHIAEKLGIRVIMALLVPGVVPTSEFPSIMFPEWKLGGWYNRFTVKLFLKLGALGFGKYIKQWRKAHGLPALRRGVSLANLSSGAPIPIMHGLSRHVIPFPRDWPDYTTMTGYWFLEQHETWQPPAPLVDFLNSGAPPVYIGFGSMAGTKTERITKIVIEAVQKSKIRAILCTGWGGLNAKELPDSIFQIDAAPHDWLFPRMAAVVHHGGAGTTAAALRAGKPALICPFVVDQPFWGRRIHALGAGPAHITQNKLAVDNLAPALRDLVDNTLYRQKAEAVGEKLRTEDSIGPSLEFIERQVKR